MTNDEFIFMLSEKYYRPLFQFIARTCRDKSMILDIVQDTFLIASEKADELQTHENVRAWLYRTARYRMLQLLVGSLNYDDLSALADRIGDDGNFEDDCIASLEQKYPSMADQLDAEDLQLVIKHYEEGYDFQELAKEYHTTEASIKMRLQRIKKRLRKSLTV